MRRGLKRISLLLEGKVSRKRRTGKSVEAIVVVPLIHQAGSLSSLRIESYLWGRERPGVVTWGPEISRIVETFRVEN
jgi:hypothetical protein